jgi:hypothetical protein
MRFLTTRSRILAVSIFVTAIVLFFTFSSCGKRSQGAHAAWPAEDRAVAAEEAQPFYMTAIPISRLPAGLYRLRHSHMMALLEQDETKHYVSVQSVESLEREASTGGAFLDVYWTQSGKLEPKYKPGDIILSPVDQPTEVAQD